MYLSFPVVQGIRKNHSEESGSFNDKCTDFPCLDILGPMHYMESKSYSHAFTTASAGLFFFF